MPYTITKKMTLRSRDVPPLKDASNLDPAVAASLANIGRALRLHPAMRARSISTSADGLTKTTITVWDSRAAYIEFVATNQADLAGIASASAAYNKANGIAVGTATSGD